MAPMRKFLKPPLTAKSTSPRCHDWILPFNIIKKRNKVRMVPPPHNSLYKKSNYKLRNRVWQPINQPPSLYMSSHFLVITCSILQCHYSCSVSGNVLRRRLTFTQLFLGQLTHQLERTKSEPIIISIILKIWKLHFCFSFHVLFMAINSLGR